MTYRGFQLIECVCCYPPELAGRTAISVHDYNGIAVNVPTLDDARSWIDRQCEEADRLLAAIGIKP